MPQEYKWYELIQVFVNKLNLKPNEVYKMNYIDCLNWLSYWDVAYKISENKN